MTRKILLATAAVAALTLGACSKQDAQQTADTTANTASDVGSDIGNAADETGNAIGNTASDLGQSKPVNAVQDAAGAVVGLGSAATTTTADSFVPAAAISDMYEIQASKLALQKSQSPAVKKFAEKMIADHTATTAKLKSTLASANLNIMPPTALDSRRQGMIDNLKAAAPADFDKTYADQQTNAHREALTLMKTYADHGDNPALTKFAADTAPKIQMHLDMIKDIDKSGADGK